MAGDLYLFPRTELFIGLLQLTLDARLQFSNLIGNVDTAIRTHMAEFFNLALQIGNWLLKIKKMSHFSELSCICRMAIPAMRSLLILIHAGKRVGCCHQTGKAFGTG